MKPLVIYHGGCFDGFCAAWVARRKLGDYDFVPMNYGNQPPDVTGKEVYILDFSFPREVMIDLTQKARKLVCLDHHESAAAALQGLSAGSDEGLIRFDMTKSGARLAWEYFFPGESPPWTVLFTEDRDLWKYLLPHSREINAALRSYPMDFNLWDQWACFRDVPPFSFRVEGEAILRAQQQMIDSAVKNAVEIDMDGHRILSVNTTVLMSEIGEALAKGRPFSATFFIRGDGRKVWSLRSREGGVNVSVIARNHKGGGHQQAAGFTE